MTYGTGGEVEAPKAGGADGVEAVGRVGVPAPSELVEVVAVPAVTLTAGPRLAPSDWNWTLPTAAVGVTLAVRLRVVPAVCGLAGVAVRVLLVLGAGGGHHVWVQVVPLTL